MLRSKLGGFLSAAVLVIGGALPASAAVSVGDKPVLQFNSANGGGQVSLEKYKGKIIIVDFWATWCGPCMAEADHMVQVNNTYAPQGLQFIGISLVVMKGRDHNIPLAFGPYLAIAGMIALFFGTALVKIYLPG